MCPTHPSFQLWICHVRRQGFQTPVAERVFSASSYMLLLIYKTQRSWELICRHFLLYRLLRIEFLFDWVKWQPLFVFHFECHGRPSSLSRDLGPHEDLWQKISNWGVPCLRRLVSHISLTNHIWHCKVSNYDPWLKATKPSWTLFSFASFIHLIFSPG